MSVRVMSYVWELSQAKGSQLLLLLAIADYAGDDGLAWPGLETLAHKSRLSKRQVIRIVQELENMGELYILKGLRYNRYLVNVWPLEDNGACQLCGLRKLSVVDEKLVTNNLHNHHIFPIEHGGPKNGKTILLCQDCHILVHQKMKEWGLITSSDILSLDILSSTGDKNSTIGDKNSTIGDTAMSLKPLTIKEPPLTDPVGAVFSDYENNIGLLTSAVSEKISGEIDSGTPPEWISEAIKIAALKNKRFWNYIEGILKRWRVNGKDSRQEPIDIESMASEVYQ